MHRQKRKTPESCELRGNFNKEASVLATAITSGDSV